MSIFTYLILGGIGLLLLVFIITLFQTPWMQWRHKQDTKRREPKKWKKDPFTDFRKGSR